MPNRLSLIALITAGLAAAWVVLEWRFDPTPDIDVRAESVAEAPTTVELPEPEDDFTPIDEFKGTLVRPLFVQGRRQEPDPTETDGLADQAPAAPEAPPPSMKLTAIIVNDQERSALLLPAGEQQSARVAPGETVAGWEVVEIRDDAVVIRARGREQTLTLREFGPPGAVPTRPAKPDPRAQQAKTRPDASAKLQELRRRAAERAANRQRTE